MQVKGTRHSHLFNTAPYQASELGTWRSPSSGLSLTPTFLTCLQNILGRPWMKLRWTTSNRSILEWELSLAAGWLSAAYKSPERVRCTIVAKDIRKGTTARYLGFSSPTPSIEGLHCLLTMSANRNFRLNSVDIAHAFMHSPMPAGEHVCLKLPLSATFRRRVTCTFVSLQITERAEERVNALALAFICHNQVHWTLVWPGGTMHIYRASLVGCCYFRSSTFDGLCGRCTHSFSIGSVVPAKGALAGSDRNDR